jgi:trimeric autotransporter adhesin
MAIGRGFSSSFRCFTSMGWTVGIGAVLIAADGLGGRPIAAQTNGIVSLTLSPATIAGGSGDAATGTVTLSAPAPSGGAMVALASSNIELAATLPSVTVPEGQTSAAFIVGTNAGYRRYSNLSFSVTLSATYITSRSANLTVTAQPRPPDFNSGSTAGANTQWEGLMCGGLAPIGGEQGILYDCSPADTSGFGQCTFRQECALGCRRVPPNGSTYRDFCATTGPNPVAISRNYIISGDRVAGSIVSEAPAGQGVDQEVGEPGSRSIEGNASHFPHSSGGIVFPDGATTVPFEVATSYVPTIQFVAVDGFWFNESIPPLLITNGRAGQVWLAMVPPDPPPAVALPTLGDFFISGLNPIVGGETTFGQVDLSGLSRAGGPTLTLTSSHPDIVPPKTIVAPVSENLFGFQAFFETNPTSVDTDVTVTVSDGRYSFSDVLTVRAAPPPPVLDSISVNPTSVVGGSSATGTVRLSAPQSGPTVVQVSIIDTAPASLPSNDPPCPPSSRCHNVTVPAGATSASFTITTSPVTSQFNLNIFAHLAGSPGRQALLLITAGGATTLKSVTITPDSMVGGASATGRVTLTAAAPSTGAVVTLSKALANGGSGTVPVSIPASVTVPAGQTTATFTIASGAVTAPTVVRISGTYGGTTLNADVSLFPLLGQILFSGNVPGGTPATGTVTLNGAAPVGGAVIALSSANTSLVSVPPGVTVPAGQTSATFIANTAPVTQTTAVAVSASLAGTTATTNLFLVVSTAVASVTLNPNTVIGPASSTATVTLRSAAVGNAVVELASSNTVVATVPFSVIVPSGQTSATFTVNAAQVTETRTAVISATYESVTRSATLTVNPAGGGGGLPGFFGPSSNAPDSGGDGNGFESGPLNAHQDDAAVAADVNSGTGTGTSCTSTGKDRHRFFDFGLSVPAGSAVGGIEVRLEARADSTSGSPRMCVQLSWNGGATWTAEKATGTLGTALNAFTVGGAADTWGRAWSAADLANANFRLRVINVAGSTSRDFFLDWVAVRPHFAASGPATLNAVTVSPTSLTGGANATGTVTLTSGAPAGGAVVSLASSNAAAVVPTTITIPAGATSTNFTIATAQVGTPTSVTLSATYNGVTRSTLLTVNPPSQTATLTVTATGRTGERVLSTPAGISVPVGSSGTASFAVGTSITLSVSNGRDAIWSGACSSGGEKRRTCTFTLSGNGSVTANVQ